MSIMWRFPSNDYGEQKGINDSGISLFRGNPLKSLAREICQNSLDAAINDKQVIIDFDVFEIPTNNIPGVDELKDAFKRSIDFWKVQKAKSTKQFFEKALNIINQNTCYFLRISDHNTIGLTGSRGEINTNWINLTKSSGSSDKKGTAGGSYGIGKFAPFACSDFSTVFYSTYDLKKEEAYQGVSRIVTFRREDGETTQGTGYYGNEKNTPVYKQINIDPNYSRKENDFGTDIYIAGYSYASEDWQKNIIVSILDSFLGAIWKDKLIINVGDIVISKYTIKDLIEVYREDLIGYTDKYFEVLISKDTVWNETNFMGLGNIKLGLLLGEQDSPNKIAMIRQTGMKIMDKDRLPGHTPFTGVMFIEGEKINERLRSIENPEHTKWDPERSKNPIIEKELLKEINKYIREKIEELIFIGNKNEIDAVGVGNFLPDDIIEDDGNDKDETISDKIFNIEKIEVKKKNYSGMQSGNFDMQDEVGNIDGHMESGGDKKAWFHPGGTIINRQSKMGQDAHIEFGGKETGMIKKLVSINKFLNICVNKEMGIYVLVIIPSESEINGTVEIYLSGESSFYEAPIKSMGVIGKNITASNTNKLDGLEFVKDQPIRIKIELDYKDYCSMEVKAYATKK